VKVQIRNPKTGENQIVEVESIPYSTEQELFNFYKPNVPEKHPLFGKTVKVKIVVKTMGFQGVDELGNPQITLTSDLVVAVE